MTMRIYRSFDTRLYPVLFAPSCCDGCGWRLTSAELMPIFSYLLQDGMCACRRYRLSRALLIAEITGAGIGLFCFVFFPPVTGLALLGLGACLWICLLTDAYWLRLYMPLIAVMGCGGGLIAVYTEQGMDSLLSGCSGFFLFLCIEKIYLWCRKKQGMGAGDKWLIAAIGLWVNLWHLLFILQLGCLFGFAHAALLSHQGRMHKDTALPFGSYLCAAAILIAPLHFAKLEIT